MEISKLREKYLYYFKNKAHAIAPSASLIPENDPTTLFTGSGMQPQLPYLLGEKRPLGIRVADAQKCFRAGDMEEAGDNRHTTFFEMLGNWSFGDYFKEEQINWVFDFLFNEIKLNPEQFYVTVFRGREDLGIPKDTVTIETWQKLFKTVSIDAQVVDFPEKDGLGNGRIFCYGEKNWWSRAGGPDNMPIGEPGGPDSEMFWDFGADLKLHENSVFKDEPCHPNCDCGRFMEIGNNVFMAYIKTQNGFELLPKKNIDFGGGLERIGAAANNDPDVFNTSDFQPIIKSLELMTGKSYTKSSQITAAFRVIADHMRAVTFLICDGASPSNKDQGYFTRRLLRRAVTFAFKLGIEKNFCKQIAQNIVSIYGDYYTELQAHQENILALVDQEETKFRQTLVSGLQIFEKLIQSKKAETNKVISGEDAFDLYQSYGFPVEMSQELAIEKGYEIDLEDFKVQLKKHQEISRSGMDKKFKSGLADHSENSVKYHTATHLLHKALKDLLGESVEQKGSNITEERLRFDFSYPTKLTPEQIAQVEESVNQVITQGLDVSFTEVSQELAKKEGAIGLFGSKYGEMVKVYTVGNYSKEICTGPHVKNTSEMGTFKIIKEEAISTGVRRIKAVLV